MLATGHARASAFHHNRPFLPRPRLDDQRVGAIDDHCLPVVQSAVSDLLGAVSGHDLIDGSRLWMRPVP
jgi:hypothetical protein